MIIIAGIFAAAMLAGAVCVATKAGENENICRYGYHSEEDEKQ